MYLHQYEKNKLRAIKRTLSFSKIVCRTYSADACSAVMSHLPDLRWF